MMLVFVIIAIIAFVIVERQKRLQQKHREMLMKVVETFKSCENDIFYWFFSEDDRKEYRRLIELGRYDHCSVEDIKEDMEKTEYVNWCAR